MVIEDFHQTLDHATGEFTTPHNLVTFELKYGTTNDVTVGEMLQGNQTDTRSVEPVDTVHRL